MKVDHYKTPSKQRKEELSNKFSSIVEEIQNNNDTNSDTYNFFNSIYLVLSNNDLTKKLNDVLVNEIDFNINNKEAKLNKRKKEDLISNNSIFSIIQNSKEFVLNIQRWIDLQLEEFENQLSFNNYCSPHDNKKNDININLRSPTEKSKLSFEDDHLVENSFFNNIDKEDKKS
jgi:hypothetical protein